MTININNLSNNAQVTARQAEQKSQQLQQQSATNSPLNQSAAPKPDSVSLTASQQLSSAHKKANDASGIDQDKVEKYKKAINEGTFNVDAERLATNMISAEKKLFGL